MPKKSGTITVQFLTYRDILLRTYLEIARTNDYLALVVKGSASLDQCADAWEEIIKQNSVANGSLSHSSHMSAYRQFVRLIAKYNGVKATLLSLCYRIDDEDIAYLRKEGYKIDLTNTNLYAESLTKGLRKVESLRTQITMKYNELMRDAKDAPQSDITFDELLANLNVALGFAVGDDITLCKYNEYNKIVKRKAKKK